MAPIASSGCSGARNLRDRTTSRSAPNSLASTAPVTTPPRGIASTSGSCNSRPFSFTANLWAASSRSRNMKTSQPRVGLFWDQVANEPLFCQTSDLFQRTRLLKEVCGARDDDEFLGTTQQAKGLLVQLDHHFVVAADDQQGRRLDGR